MSEAGLQFGDRFVPHAEFFGRVAKAATGFSSLGIRSEDSVAIMLRNDVSYLEATLGARMAGSFPVPINWHLKSEEVNYILEDSDAKVLVIHSDLLYEMSEAIPEGVKVLEVQTPQLLIERFGISKGGASGFKGAEDWDTWVESHEPWSQAPRAETSSMIYTSGTTGKPKGVRRESATPEQHQAALKVASRVLGMAPGASTVVPAPMYHSAPNAFSLFAMQLGAFLVIQPRFDAEELLAIIEKYKITCLQMVPTMFVRLLKLPDEVRAKYDLSSLEYVVHAAAPCPPQIKKAMIDWWGPIIWEYYGSTEMGAVTHCSSEDALKYPGTVGRALEEATVKVLDEEGNEVPAGTIGNIYGQLDVSTDFTYQKDDAKRRSIERNGMITSGDVGYFNEEGFLFLCDRANDMIISGGVNIYPAEIEGVLIDCPGVHDCAVFGIPDEDFGEAIMAVIELEEGAKLDAAEAQSYLEERLAHYKVPKTIEFQTDLPREDSGKLFKRKLREPYWKDAGRNI
ncbi:MAG: acyl-CoA synthetase [Candidatus Hydrogenedentes bacterium]|nr:acyl-CoA synthetase [Candidatus Hydrogenedentota bacterium]